MIKAYPQGHGNHSVSSLDKSDTTLIENHMAIKKTISTHEKLREEPASVNTKVYQQFTSIRDTLLVALRLTLTSSVAS